MQATRRPKRRSRHPLASQHRVPAPPRRRRDPRVSSLPRWALATGLAAIVTPALLSGFYLLPDEPSDATPPGSPEPDGAATAEPEPAAAEQETGSPWAASAAATDALQALALPGSQASAAAPASPTRTVPTEPKTADPAAEPDPYAGDRPDDGTEITIDSGDTLSSILAEHGHGAATVHRVLAGAGEHGEALSALSPGDELTLVEQGDELSELRLPLSAEDKLRVHRDGDGFTAELLPRELDRSTELVAGRVDGSLYASARRAGLSDRLIMQTAHLLDGEIDLGREVQAGDRFRILYTEVTPADGEEVLERRLQGLLLHTDDRKLKGIRFTTEEDGVNFYTPQGRNLTLSFKRFPLEFRRISSHFDRDRRHPILDVRRPHLGVDLAAPHGTPVRAAAEGRVVERRRNGGYGRVITLEHPGPYKTRYAHLSRYASGLEHGDRVDRGETIGYVGESGKATGPHLHYEFIENGHHRDPVAVDLPRDDPLPERYEEAFEERAAPVLAALQGEPEPDGELRLAERDGDVELP